jgi:hypothetical protein
MEGSGSDAARPRDPRARRGARSAPPARIAAGLALALALGAACRRAEPPPPTRLARIDAALARAGAFLTGQQADDGAWRSRTYAAFKDGWSLTPLVLLALRFTSADAAGGEAHRRGVEHLVTLPVGERGDALRYPLYSLALGALVLNAPGHERHRPARDAMLGALRARQLADGGWGYDLRTGNLSATVYAVGALALAGAPADDPALAAARGFVERCQDPGGGFFFSPADADANKAGADATGAFRPYGSMTADGVRALLRLGVAAEDPRLQAAAAWLERHFDPARNPGDFPPEAEVRRESAYYYWAWSAAHALRALGRPVLQTAGGERRWAEALADELLARQDADGAWRSRFGEMREDDPLVATPLAAAALAVTRQALTGEYQSHAGW